MKQVSTSVKWLMYRIKYLKGKTIDYIYSIINGKTNENVMWHTKEYWLFLLSHGTRQWIK